MESNGEVHDTHEEKEEKESGPLIGQSPIALHLHVSNSGNRRHDTIFRIWVFLTHVLFLVVLTQINTYKTWLNTIKNSCDTDNTN